MKTIHLLLCLPLAAGGLGAQPAPKVLVDRVGDTGFIQLEAESFNSLNPRQQALAYWLSQASIAIDPIIYDQLSSHGLRVKRLLEEIIRHRASLPAESRAKLEAYAKLFWANRGNHNLATSQKFLPGFSASELQAAAAAAQADGAFQTGYADLPALATPGALATELADLGPTIFDPQLDPMITAKSPRGGLDIIQASGNTFYAGVTLADLKNFKSRYPLNSRLVKGADGRLTEEVYRAGTPDGAVPPGLYAIFLGRAVVALRHAEKVAVPEQAAAIRHLIDYYETGEFRDWLSFGISWVQADTTVDFDNGFIEVYRDANGMKGSSQSFVTITDEPLTRATKKLAENAAYFEARAPWLEIYKKKDFRPPVIKAVETVIETGDFEVSTIGDNLPNENDIHENYGSKNFLFTASSRALKEASGHKSAEEFYADRASLERYLKYGNAADDLMTALHEVIGHGSGKLSERVKGGAEAYLKEYFSTLEEARADLMALWNVWDPKLVELGLVRNQEEIAKAMYDRAALNLIVPLRGIPHGDTIEEDHLRDRALIANFIRERTGAIRLFQRGGKTYVEVTDYAKMRAGVGQLLAELMRIKAEGDYAAIQALVNVYGVHFDPALRDQVVARYQALGLPTYWAGVNPRLEAKFGPDGEVTAVTLSYPRDPILQYLGYGLMYQQAR